MLLIVTGLQVCITFFGEYTSASVPRSCVVPLPKAVQEAKLHQPKVANAKLAARFRLSLQEMMSYMAVGGCVGDNSW